MPATTQFLPRKESDLIVWSTHFSDLISADPAAYGLDIAAAAAFATLNTAWVSAFNVANANDTRTPSSIVAKNDAKAAMEANARELARIIQADPTVTDEQRADLGLTVRDPEPSPVPVPSSPPQLIIRSAAGRNVKIRLRDADEPDSRGKPDGVVSAAVMSYIGAAPPAPEDVAAWTFEGVTTRNLTSINFPSTVESGATAWLTAVWLNTKGQSSLPSEPISVQIPGSLPMAA